MADTFLDKVASAGTQRYVKAAFWIAVLVFSVLAYRFWPAGDAWQRALTPDTVRAAMIFVFLQVVTTALRALRWRVFLRPDVAVPPFKVIAVFAWCFFLNGVFPYRTGEAARLIWTKRFGGSVGYGLGALAAERLIDLVAVLGLAGVGVALLPTAPAWLSGWVDVYLAAVAGGFLILIAAAAPVGAWLKRLADRQRSRLFGFVAGAVQAAGLMRTPGRFLAVAGLTVATWAVFTASCQIYLSGFFPAFGWGASAAFAAVVTFSAIVPLTPGNLGAFEASAVILLSALGYDEALALVAAATMHGILLITTTALGGIGWLAEVRRTRSGN